MSDIHDHDHQAMNQAAVDRYQVVADDYRTRFNALFCIVCGAIGYRLLQRIGVELVLAEETDPEERRDLNEMLIHFNTTPMPEHWGAGHTQSHE